MTTPKDGSEPAFPSCGADGAGPNGISVRDYFAAKALQGMLTNGFLPGIVSQSAAQEYDWPKAAYQIADAMLAERERLK